MNGSRQYPTGHRLAALAAALMAFFAATTQAQGAAGAHAEVNMAKYQFTPQTVHIAVGGSVSWINGDKRAHIVSFGDSGGSAEIAPGSSYQRRFERPGEYPYVCGIHSSMRGVVIVE